MKKILGLDLGSTSIGWAFIEESDTNKVIKKMGVRVIPYTGDENDKFQKGQAITVNKDRTLKRTARKTNHRYKQRRKKLLIKLAELNMLPAETAMKQVSPLEIYGLRAKAVTAQLNLQEIGRVLLLLNQKRGYRGSRFSNPEEEGGKKMSDYLTEMSQRKEILEAGDMTIGQYFYTQLSKDRHFRVKNNVFPRECYIAEFNAIVTEQKKHYGDLLSDEVIAFLRDEVIFFQRNLKSQKGLVAECAFEKHHKVAPKSSPLFQLEKIWESVHNISLYNKNNERYPITHEQKNAIAAFLCTEEKMSGTQLLKILGLKRTDGWKPNDQIGKSGIQGNTTYIILKKAYEKMELEDLSPLAFNLKFKDLVNRQTGEVVENGLIDASFEHEPLYKLWHVLYSIDDPVHLVKVLQSKFGYTANQAAILNKIDFKKQGFGSKSSRAIRKLLPQLMNGSDYTQAAQIAGYNHSNSITKAENDQRPLLDKVELYKRNALRQPVVEKVLNQLVNLVNAIITEASLGRPDEIRIELARELRQSKDERERTTKMNNARNKEYQDIIARLSEEYPGLAITSKVLEKYRLYQSQEGICLYTGKRMELAMVLRGEGVDIDHIIPQSKLFDDSFQNKVLVYRQANLDKSNRTAMDYISSISSEAEHQYKERIDKLHDDKCISNAKRNRLLMKESEIPSDFISRQLNETRFISKEATKLLTSICRKVTSTSGSVTEFLRNQWGYNDVLQQLNFSKYEQAGLTTNGKIDKDKWSKRDDHRHHAIDALVVAATSQGMIQQLNTLNSSRTREEMLAAIEGKTSPGWQQKKSLVEQYAQARQPFNTEEVKQAAAEIIISMKPGKKVAVPSKKKGQAVLVPRGQLHNETVYGKIKRYAAEKTPLNGRFKLEYLDKIVSEKERNLIAERLATYDNDPKRAFKNLEASPIFLDEAKSKTLTAVTLWEEHYVVKYKLNETFKEQDVQYIVDSGIRELVRQRLEQHGNDSKKAFQNLEKDPIWKNKAKGERVTSVRCFTNKSNLIAIHKSVSGQTLPQSAHVPGAKPVDFVSPSNNHHLAIYQLSDGSYLDIAVSLWEAVNRKKAGLPVVIEKPKEAWDKVLEIGLDDQQLLNNLPPQDAVFLMNMAQNEFFILGYSKEEVEALFNENDLSSLSKKIFRIQKISNNPTLYINCRHHLETRVDDKQMGGEMLSKQIGRLVSIRSIKALLQQNPVKIKLNVMGQMQLA